MFDVEDAEIKVFPTSAKPNLLILAVNRQPIAEWFKEQWDNSIILYKDGVEVGRVTNPSN